MKTTVIQIDDREPLSTIGGVKQVAADQGIDVIVSRLDAGDAWIIAGKDIVIVERKTPNDLLGSIKDERIFMQAAKMRELSQWSYIYIQGMLVPDRHGYVLADYEIDIDSSTPQEMYRQTSWTWASLQGALMTLQELGMTIIHAGKQVRYGDGLIGLGERNRDTRKVKPSRDLTITTASETILASIPGIGANKAADILEYCGNVADSLQYLTIPGKGGPIGVTLKEKIKQSLGLKPDEMLLKAVVEVNGHSTSESTESIPIDKVASASHS